MIEYPIVDTHVHLWDTKRYDYPWLQDVPFLNRPFLLEDYDRLTESVEVGRMVFVQAEIEQTKSQDEARWVSELAKSDRRIQGIVAFAPLEHGKGAEADVAELADDPLVKGIRRLIQSEPDPEFCLKPDFVSGVQMLGEFDLSFDICINHKQLEATIGLVEQCPDVSFILDHIAKPDIKSRLIEPWATHVRTLARFPNVVCKISGLVTEADHENWTDADLRPYIRHVVDAFGFDRVMYGSDWPVAYQATEYPRWVRTLYDAVALFGATEAEIRRLFVENAERAYRLG